MEDMAEITEVNPKKNIIIKGAKLHNLKNIDSSAPFATIREALVRGEPFWKGKHSQ